MRLGLATALPLVPPSAARDLWQNLGSRVCVSLRRSPALIRKKESGTPHGVPLSRRIQPPLELPWLRDGRLSSRRIENQRSRDPVREVDQATEAPGDGVE
jgi:hypothetical protein